MRRDHRKQPWQTFPFWFLILSGLAMTVAWKFDLLKAKPHDIASEQPLAEEEVSPDWASESDIAATAPEQEPIDSIGEQSEPVGDPETARTFPAEEMRIASNDSEIAEDKQIDNPFADSAKVNASSPSAGESQQHAEESQNPFSRNQVRITPVSGSRTIPAATKDPSKDRSRNPFGPATTEIQGTRSRQKELEPQNTESAETPAAAETHPVSPAASTARADEDLSSDRPAAEQAASAASSNAKPKASAGSVDFQEIDRLIEQGEDVEANFQLSNIYWKRPEVRPQLMQRLRAVAYRIYFAPQPHYMEGYVVKPGDTLQNISKKYDVSWEYLANLNRTDAKKIRPEQKLKVIKGPFAAVVDLSDREMTIHSHGHFVALFSIGLGQDQPSPGETLKVQDKQRDPTYYGPEGVIEHDDAKNPLGEYLVDLGEGMGIHGTNDQGSLANPDAPGCIRMKSRDIVDVFDLLTVGSEVLIKK